MRFFSVKLYYLSVDFFDYIDHDSKHEFEDSLAMCLKWCDDNNMRENLLSVGIYGLGDAGSDFFETKVFLEKRLNAIAKAENNFEYLS